MGLYNGMMSLEVWHQRQKSHQNDKSSTNKQPFKVLLKYSHILTDCCWGIQAGSESASKVFGELLHKQVNNNEDQEDIPAII